MTSLKISRTLYEVMINLSTRQAAKKLGIGHSTLAHYIEAGKVPAPKSITSGGITVHIWSEKEIERIRKILPKIQNGRKTRWKKQAQKKPKR